MSAEEDLYSKIYELVKQIPEGRVCTYGIIGTKIGGKLSARMVGWAMNAAHSKPEVPAHRVVNRNGCLTGRHHFATSTLMQELLENEGVKVKDHCVINFAAVLWHP